MSSWGSISTKLSKWYSERFENKRQFLFFILETLVLDWLWNLGLAMCVIYFGANAVIQCGYSETYTGITFTGEANESGFKYVSIWDLPAGNYTCLICADLMGEAHAREFVEKCEKVSPNQRTSTIWNGFPGKGILQSIGLR